MNFTERQITDGKDRLARLLPDIRKEAMASLRESNTGIEILSPRGQAIDRHLRFDNLEALVVHQSDEGWHADLLLKKTPPGIANVLGTPTSQPLATRDEAEESATEILRMAVTQATLNTGTSYDTAQEDVRPFSIYNLIIDLPGEAVDAVVSLGSSQGHTPEDFLEFASSRMKQVCDRHGISDTTTSEDIDRLSQEDQMEIFRIACMIASSGRIGYPSPDGVDPEHVTHDDDPGPG